MPHKKDKRGRKKLEVKRDAMLHIRFTKDEAKQIKKQAKIKGFDNKSQLVRDAVLQMISK